MCGRYAFFTERELKEINDIIDHLYNDEKYNKMKTGEIFPSDLAPVLMAQGGQIRPKLVNWGFPNLYSKGLIINARSDTARQKRMFSRALDSQRCIIPSTGFYEWNKEKTKHIFNLPKSPVLYMAGLCSTFDREQRFVILTTDANESVSSVHSRMPVVLSDKNINDWLFNAEATDIILTATPPELVSSTVY